MPPAAVTAEFELMLFGAPRVLHRGALLHFGSRKALTILAILALDGSTTRERLAALLWPEADASAARRNLRRDLFRLRDLQLPLQEVADGHLALAAGWRIDVLQFRAALTRDDDAAALTLASPQVFEGLDGVAGADVDRWLTEQRSALLRQRQQARLRLAQARREAGDTDTALFLWQQALDEDPCQEAALLPAMQLLVQRGERAVALALFERTRDALRRELDLAPTGATSALADGLRGTPPAMPPRATPAEPAGSGRSPPLAALRAERLPWVGRDEVLAALQSHWHGGRRVFIQGEPGVGKTRLAVEAAATAGAWLRLPCHGNDREQPYRTAVNALRALRDAAPDLVLPEWVQRELAQLLPEFGAAPEHVPGPEQGARLRRAFAEALQQLAEENFDAVVLDDWQWCDADSVPLLDALGRGGGLRAVFTCRSGELPAPLQQALQAELDQGEAALLELEGLAGDALKGLLEQLGVVTSDAFVERLHDTTRGNPFHVIETLRHLDDRGALPGAAVGAALPLPPTVREAVLMRVRALGDVARRLLEAASLLGGAFSAAAVQAVVGADEGTTIDSMERAEAARLLVAHGPTYHFAHDLVRQCLAESLSPARRQSLHARLAAELAARDAAPALVAAQHEQAGQRRLAVPWRLRAGAQAARMHALDEAVQQYHAALADEPLPAEGVVAQLALFRLHERRADSQAADQALRGALAQAELATLAERIEARLACAEHWSRIDRGHDVLALIDSMAGDLAQGTPVQRGRACMWSAMVHGQHGRHEQAQRLYEQAAELLETSADALPMLARVFDDMARNALRRQLPEQAEACARRAVAAFETVSDQGGLARALVILGVATIHAERPRAQSCELLERARDIARRCGHVPAQRAALANLIKLATDIGDAEGAKAMLDEAVALMPGFENRATEQAFVGYAFHIHRMRGDDPAILVAARRMIELARGLDERRLLLEAVESTFDDLLRCSGVDEAGAALDEAESMMRDEPALAQSHPDLGFKRALWHLARQESAAAEAAWQSAAGQPGRRLYSEVLRACVGARCALACGDVSQARQRLQALDPQCELLAEPLGDVLCAQLALAAAVGHDEFDAAARAQPLLDSGQLPQALAAELREALQRFTEGVGKPTGSH